MKRPKDIGTQAETKVVRYLRENGWGNCERRALTGSMDQGDVTGIPGLCVEVKAGEAAMTASDGQVTAWLAETETERVNARADIGILVLRRRGKGSAGDWWAVVDAAVLAQMVRPDEWVEDNPMGIPVRLLLRDLIPLLHAAGYGDPTAGQVAS